MKVVDTDFLVIGSGLAGLTYALNVAPYGSVSLLTKKNRTDANSSWAQGGIAGVLSEDDSFELHAQDTLIAGAGLCNERAVEILVTEGPERIRDLIKLGAVFNTERKSDGSKVLSLGREGGHSRNRIVHTADYTGWECEKTLLEVLRATPQIKVYEHYFVTDLAVSMIDDKHSCFGAYALNVEDGDLVGFRAKSTFLATGGCGQVYKHTTNPQVATGDGVAMAWRAGAIISDMEFIQFHPTTLYHPDARAFLITEALRGEGGILRHGDGSTFMDKYHKLAELAPRDIVARAIVREMQIHDVPCVYLDVTHLDPEMLKTHFPTVYERCLSVGIDICQQPIPIVPAQHYQCGGVQTDMNGFTGIDRLYAAGEVTCTGVHGANRLASNSLLEAMVFGYRAAIQSRNDTTPLNSLPFPEVTLPPVSQSNPDQMVECVTSIKAVMQKQVGILRTTHDLLDAQSKVSSSRDLLQKLSKVNADIFEACNIAEVALLIIESAIKRHESRGLHYVQDYPDSLDTEKHDTLLKRDELQEWSKL